MSIDHDALADRNYRSYVGPEHQYDLMGASQFRLLCALGLRSSSRVLDLGCGSLRAGRLLIPWLDSGCYYGIDPNQWLIDEAIEKETGRDMIAIKQPEFDNNDAFDATVFDTDFDYILAQSIFSHTGRDLLERALSSCSQALSESGLLVATFLNGIDMDHCGWVYPKCTTYEPKTIRNMASEVGLAAMAIPWFHPRQTWWLMARDASQLPDDVAIETLHGAVLREPAMAASLGGVTAVKKKLSRWYKYRILARFRKSGSSGSGV